MLYVDIQIHMEAYQNPLSGVGVINKLLYDYHMGKETKI